VIDWLLAVGGWSDAGLMRSPTADQSIRLEQPDHSPRHQPVKVPLTLNHVKVTLDEVEVVNSSCVRLSWQLIGQQRAAVQWLRVQYWAWSDGRGAESSPSTALVTTPTADHHVLCGLEVEKTRYGLCIEPVYTSGVVGECSDTRQTAPLLQHRQHGNYITDHRRRLPWGSGGHCLTYVLSGRGLMDDLKDATEST